MAAVLDSTTSARTGQGRLLRWALLISVALHLAILLGLPEFIQSQRKLLFPGPITAHLQPAPAPAPAPAPKPLAEAPRPEPKAVRPKPEPPKRARPEPVLTAPAPSPVQVPAQPVAPPAAVVEATPAPAPSPATATESSAAASTARGTGSAPGTDEVVNVGQYRIAFIEVARRLKTYPRLAQENNWEGRVLLQVSIAAGGGLAGIIVKASSGHAVLDKNATDLMRRTHAQTPVPASLRGREFSIEVPVVFGLRDG